MCPKPSHNGSVLKPGTPVRPERIRDWKNDIDAAWQATGPCYVQPKYDGWEIQIHVWDGEVALFTRTCEDYTTKFPKVAEVALAKINAKEAVIDSEVVPYDPENQKILRWNQTVKSEYHKIIAFDILYLNGKDLTADEMSYAKRRHELLEIIANDKKELIEVVDDVYVHDIESLKSFYNVCLQFGLEGVIVKSPDGVYRPGSQKSAKGKIKPRHTLDVVVICYTMCGLDAIKSLRVGVMSPSGGVVDICDVMIQPSSLNTETHTELLNRLESLRTGEQYELFENLSGGSYSVRPEMVVEIESMFRVRDAGFVDTGFTLRNPKLCRVRMDKGFKEIDTLETFLRIEIAPNKDERTALRQLMTPELFDKEIEG